MGPDPLLPVLTSTVTISVALEEMIAAPHAIVVEGIELNTDNRTTLACGTVGGVTTDGELHFGLQAQVADISGIAWLRSNSDGMTTVTLFVTQGVAAGGYAALHSPTAGDLPDAATVPPTEEAVVPATTNVTVASYDIYFDPAEFPIPANTDVVAHLPNNGVILHNFSITGHKNENVPNRGISIDIQPGSEESVTINAPARDYYYFCNVPGHEAAEMFGTMHVMAP